jgi:DNA-binding response OmpR family regulator
MRRQYVAAMAYRQTLPQHTALLVCEAREADDPVWSALSAQGFHVEATTGADVACARASFAELIVLDLDLAGIDAIEVCRQLRAATTGYIVAVGRRASGLGLVLSLSVGADDFVAKPVEIAEFVARVRALLRRPRRLADTSAVLRFADLEIDTDLREARVGGRPVALSSLEFELLETLARNPKLTLSRRQLLDQVWGSNWFRDDHVIDVHISNLRRKLSDNPQLPKYIRTVRGFGFRMQVDTPAVRVA